tara:strand:- start:986 stop:1291 length:306 start_codon:yes stop_codon:yes gene_type:complete
VVEPLEVPVGVQVGLVYLGKAMLVARDLLLLQDTEVEAAAVLVPMVEMDLARLEALVALALLVQSLVHPFIMLAEAVAVLTNTEPPGRAVMVEAVLEVGLV